MNLNPTRRHLKLPYFHKVSDMWGLNWHENSLYIFFQTVGKATSNNWQVLILCKLVQSVHVMKCSTGTKRGLSLGLSIGLSLRLPWRSLKQRRIQPRRTKILLVSSCHEMQHRHLEGVIRRVICQVILWGSLGDHPDREESHPGEVIILLQMSW